MSQITSHLWLGSQKDAANKKFIAAHSITYVISFELYPEPTPYIKGVTRVNISMYDSMKEASKPEYPDKVLDAITKIEDRIAQGENVMIHCSVGKSRSASIAIAYVMYKLRMTLNDAFDFVYERRNVIDPEGGFLERIQEMRDQGKI